MTAAAINQHCVFCLDDSLKSLRRARPIQNVYAKRQGGTREGGSQIRHLRYSQGFVRHQHQVEIGGLPRVPVDPRAKGAYLQCGHMFAQNAPNRFQIHGSDVNRSHGLRFESS